jgi:hypothetical protein
MDDTREAGPDAGSVLDDFLYYSLHFQRLEHDRA